MGSFVLGGGIPVSISIIRELKGLRLDEAAWKRLGRLYLRRLGMPRASFGLLFCGDARSRSLNRDWRRRDKPTDVLSFPLNPGRPPKGYAGPLGDLALNLQYTRRRLGRFAPEMAGEAAFLVLHGLLHLSGRHHGSPAAEAAMWRLSRKLAPLPPALLKRLDLRF